MSWPLPIARNLSLSANDGRPARRDLETMSAIWLLGAVGVAVWRAAETFEHGIWLVAYLVLVGFAAQLLIGRGQAKLRWRAGLAAPRRTTRGVELGLWNLGVVVVPVGVFLDTRLAVLFGTVVLLAALASFLRSVRGALEAGRDGVLGRAYLALLAFMAASAVTGLALAWDTPWLGAS
jgi:hypothetical protein